GGGVLERSGGGKRGPAGGGVIAATPGDLPGAVGQGRFRAVLFFRLNVFPIHVPALRERREDIPGLVQHFLHHFARRMGRSAVDVNPATLQLLMAYHWPGNVRELENIVERAMIVTTGHMLHVDPKWLTPPATGDVPREDPSSLATVERQAILDALSRCRGRVYGPGGAAAALGLKPTTLYGKMRKHGIAKQ